MGGDEGGLQSAMAKVLIAYVVQQSQGTVPASLKPQLDAAADQVRRAGLPLGDALLLLTGRKPAQETAAVLDKVRAEMPTIDRALTLLWAHHALNGKEGNDGNVQGSALRAAISRIEPDKSWQPADTVTGRRLFRWTGVHAVPSTISLAAAPAAPSTAFVQYDSSEPEKSSLPVKVERRLYRMVRMDAPPAESEQQAQDKSQPVPNKKAKKAKKAPPAETATYMLEPVAADAPLKTDELYLDEVHLSTDAHRPLRYGILEVPLPPGATADRTTWGISITARGWSKVEPLERARFEEMPRGYAVPIEALAGETVVRHLVRVAQTGRFVLPPARYYRMYQPDQKAFEEKTRAAIDIR
jgi:uncharacterized protein YfaS (alpha-2-macroglobulin family)